MNSSEDRLRKKLKSVGLSDVAINAAWPAWWSENAEGSISAKADLRFSLARNLGLDPRSLLKDEPQFVWYDEAKYKSLKAQNKSEQSAIASFGISLGRQLLSAMPERGLQLSDAAALRNAILSSNEFVDIGSLLAACWAMGIPIIYLKVFPLSAKRMFAMSVRAGDRYAILLAKDACYPAPIIFYIAHELGHIFAGDLQNTSALVEFRDPLANARIDDEEESIADQYALMLLTGVTALDFETGAEHFSSKELARKLLTIGPRIQSEPGTLALMFGHSTGMWDKANAALHHIYDRKIEAWKIINRIALGQLDLESVPYDTQHYIMNILGF